MKTTVYDIKRDETKEVVRLLSTLHSFTDQVTTVEEDKITIIPK